MTRNQLAYWELRWKQHYESIYVAEQARHNIETERENKRHNIVAENETKRHNIMSERLAKEENVLRRMELSIKQEQVQVEWAKLSETVRSNIVKETIDAYNAQSKRIEANAAATQAKAQLLKVMSDQAIAAAELAITAIHNQNQDFASILSANAKAFGAGWGKGALSTTLTSIESNLHDTYSDILKNVENQMNVINDKLGVDSKINITSSPTSNGKYENVDKQTDIVSKAIAEEDKIGREIYGPAWDSKKAKNTGRYSFETKTPVAQPSNATYVPPGVVVSGHSNTQKPSSITSNSPTKSSVIISPGTKINYGPGYSLGGQK